ncbi:MAG: Aspartate racemase [uncultured Nocardioidaceae bacterium]|uniref:Aspartate racemase n=1 Tax=uncultured Nocardioidaceae bacterium TaxID=253824 RepID=A0A6J4N1T0_9ACTN|nr:MAG: Aspartate racemase [uncultured Nocardioidaceae bacterium]
MQRIGLIGGMSWESTALYYRLANQLVAERLGGLHSADVVMRSIDFAVMEQLQSRGEWAEAGTMLAEVAVELEGAGAELLVLCTNTMHKVAATIEAAVDIPLVHVVDATAQAVRAAGTTSVGLLGTAFTMEDHFYRDRLISHGIDVIVPETDDRRVVHRVIYDELCRGILSESSRQQFQAIMGRLVDSGAAGIVLGCTEIELLVKQEDTDVPVFPTTRIHVSAAVDAALADVSATGR